MKVKFEVLFRKTLYYLIKIIDAKVLYIGRILCNLKYINIVMCEGRVSKLRT